jgi:hypothetical protein
MNHEKSKKHKENIEILKQVMKNEDCNLFNNNNDDEDNNDDNSSTSQQSNQHQDQIENEEEEEEESVQQKRGYLFIHYKLLIFVF